MYIYRVETFFWNETSTGEIYSEKELSPNDLQKLLIKAIKIIGDWNGTQIIDICKKCNELLGTKPTRRNITEIIDVSYYYADSSNCGGYDEDKEKNNDWLKSVIKPHYISPRFYTWYINNYTGIREYVPAKIGLNIYKDECSHYDGGTCCNIQSQNYGKDCYFPKKCIDWSD